MAKLELKEMTHYLKGQICLWDRFNSYKSKGYENIKKYISNTGLKGFFQMNDENSAKIPEDSKCYNYVLKNENNKLLGFISFRLDQIDSTDPQMFIRSIVIHPGQQGKGYAKVLLNMILSNPEKFMLKKPSKISGYIDKNNKNSEKMFTSIGDYTVSDAGDGYNYYQFDYKDLKVSHKKEK